MPKLAKIPCTLLPFLVVCLCFLQIFTTGCENASPTSKALFEDGYAVKSGEEMPIQTFKEWCKEWQIDCVTRRIGNLGDNSIDESVRRTFNKIFIEFLQSPSKFAVSRADLEASDLKQGLKVLAIDGLLTPLARQLDLIGWQDARLSGNILQLASKGGGRLSAKSGLQLGIKPISSFEFQVGDRIVTRGLTLGTGDGEREVPLRALQYDPKQPETLIVELDDRSIEKVPAWFVAQMLGEIFGIEDATLFSKTTESSMGAVSSLFPLLNWLNQPSRVLSLSRKFFNRAADELALIPTVDPALVSILKSLESLQSSSKNDQSAIKIVQVPDAALRCSANGGILVLSLDATFGVKQFYSVGQNGVGFEFYGVRASSQKIWGSFGVKRIELTPETYAIRDIPIIGKLVFPWGDIASEGGGGQTSVDCRSPIH